MESLYALFAKVLAGSALLVCVVCLGSLLAAFPVKWCWNGVVPEVWGLKEIGFWEAFCLCWLSGALIKSNLSK